MVVTRIAWQGGKRRILGGTGRCVTWVQLHMASFNRSFPSTPLKVHSQHLNLSLLISPPHSCPLALSPPIYPSTPGRRIPKQKLTMASATVQIPGVALAETLVLDSTSFMSGNLVNDVRPRFLLHTRVGGYNGPETTVNSYRRDFDWTQPMDPNTPPPVDEVGVVEWRSNSIGRPKTIIKALKQGKTFTLGAFMKVGKFGTRKYFGGIGANENEGGVKWQETDGTWRVRTFARRAVFFFWRSSLGHTHEG